jgi:hypothetical protein
MGNSYSSQYKLCNFEKVQQIIKNNESNQILINTLSEINQECLIYGTCEIDKEVELINQCLKSKLNALIIIYGKNNNDLTVITKFNQLKSLGFSNVYMYLGGLFEWLLLQDVYGHDNFPTTTSEIDILKYK